MDEDRRTEDEPVEPGPPPGGDEPVDPASPTGGDEITEEQLEADNPAEEDTLKTLDPDAPPA